MSALLLTARLALAAVFAVAGAAKLADRAGSRAALEASGVPAALARPGALLLPLAETGLAALLLIDGAARWGALGALVLLLGFVGGVSRSMARGEAPDCHCFGQLHSEPVGWRTLVRNGLLAALAGFVVLAGWNDIGASSTGWTRDLSDAAKFAVLAGIVMVAILSIGSSLFVRLLRRH